MGWFRSNRVTGGWLALLALTCQLVLAFGHVHLGKTIGFTGRSGAVPAIGSAHGAGGLPAPAAATAPDEAPAPSQPPAGLADDFCALCASLKLAAALLVPDLPSVVVPAAPGRKVPWRQAATLAVSFDHRGFDARGPPMTSSPA